MRIRKRKVIFPLSDHHFNRSPPPLLKLNGNTGKQEADIILPLDPSDNPNQLIGGATNGVGLHEEAKDCLVLLKKEDQLEGQKGGKDEMSTTDTCRKIGNLGGQLATWVLPQSTPAQQAIGRWCEGEKSIPLKKRRGSCFEGSEKTTREEHVDTLDKKGVNNVNAKMMMKTKMNKKCVAQNGGGDDNDNDDDDDYDYADQDKEKEETEKNISSNYNKKKRGAGNKRGGALMEGSRCSRVNGRGWRCSQQTLVGYSLCEHHLGKGRLRTMTSVRNRSLASTSIDNNESYKTIIGTTIITTGHHHKPLSTSSLITSDQEKKQKGSLISVLSIDDDDDIGAPSGYAIKENGDDYDDHDDDDDDHPFTMTSKKRGKLGMVKARSLSSLLGQTSSAVVAVDENEK